MAEETDEEEVMSHRDEFRDKADSAYDYLSPDLLKMLERIPEEERLTAVLKHCCAIGCMATAIHRVDLLETPRPFYRAVRQMMISTLSHLLPPLRGEEYDVEIMPMAQSAMDADPEIKSGVAEIMAKVRQALDDVATGKYASVPEAMEAIGGKFVEISEDDLDVLVNPTAKPKGKLQ